MPSYFHKVTRKMCRSQAHILPMATQVGVKTGYVECTNGIGTSPKSVRKIKVGLAQINKQVLASDYFTSSKAERGREWQETYGYLNSSKCFGSLFVTIQCHHW
jgi:hypothetical protein